MFSQPRKARHDEIVPLPLIISKQTFRRTLDGVGETVCLPAAVHFEIDDAEKLPLAGRIRLSGRQARRETIDDRAERFQDIVRQIKGVELIFVKNPVKSYVLFNKFMRIFFVIITIYILIKYICAHFSISLKYN